MGTANPFARPPGRGSCTSQKAAKGYSRGPSAHLNDVQYGLHSSWQRSFCTNDLYSNAFHHLRHSADYGALYRFPSASRNNGYNVSYQQPTRIGK